MTNIHDQHAAAFAKVSAFVILKDGERVATVAVKFPSGNSTRVWAYLHVLSLPMVRACADGGGYDKTSAAVASAARKVKAFEHAHTPSESVALAKFWNDLAPSLDRGQHWDRALEKAGFTVLQAV